MVNACQNMLNWELIEDDKDQCITKFIATIQAQSVGIPDPSHFPYHFLQCYLLGASTSSPSSEHSQKRETIKDKAILLANIKNNCKRDNTFQRNCIATTNNTSGKMIPAYPVYDIPNCLDRTAAQEVASSLVSRPCFDRQLLNATTLATKD
ncbi:hypothetical protein M9H77_15645 [Catharanthus roseus]|uniref:Uncharacterized protein n=1 Tax=Catharanthus roseus TaxID=4058 RepID=A0ACC0B0G7_CATRO|nr:hypothetical protein M9H77_15645 [Catharanthus roseus]